MWFTAAYKGYRKDYSSNNRLRINLCKNFAKIIIYRRFCMLIPVLRRANDNSLMPLGPRICINLFLFLVILVLISSLHHFKFILVDIVRGQVFYVDTINAKLSGKNGSVFLLRSNSLLVDLLNSSFEHAYLTLSLIYTLKFLPG